MKIKRREEFVEVDDILVVRIWNGNFKSPHDIFWYDKDGNLLSNSVAKAYEKRYQAINKKP